MMKSKIHRATVTQADQNYIGSVTIDKLLMNAANILANEQIAVLDVTNGARVETYVIEGEEGSGIIGINGAAAHLIHPGDKVILITYAFLQDDECRQFEPIIVHVDEKNKMVMCGRDAAESISDELLRGDRLHV